MQYVGQRDIKSNTYLLKLLKKVRASGESSRIKKFLQYIKILSILRIIGTWETILACLDPDPIRTRIRIRNTGEGHLINICSGTIGEAGFAQEVEPHCNGVHGNIHFTLHPQVSETVMRILKYRLNGPGFVKNFQFFSVFRIRIDFNVDPDPSFLVFADPDPYPDGF